MPSTGPSTRASATITSRIVASIVTHFLHDGLIDIFDYLTGIIKTVAECPILRKACKLCYADQFIQELPFGYNTMLEENGNNLSGGQKQRLAIVRALLKKTDVLIMDEATSNLDVITEQSIQKIIDELSKRMTIIVIAHRLKTVRKCDTIFVMENGRIVEHGSHNELMGENGLYSSYWKSQE